jgi:molybdenum cofactor synthesis domain-containing protein
MRGGDPDRVEAPGVSATAALIIGNEVLTAKVVDQNGPHLIARLREHGATLTSLQVVPDDVDAIVEALLLSRKRARYVITSGGVGPTHDDVTVRAVALALGRKVVRLPEMVDILRRAHPEGPVPNAALRMAEAPEGSELIAMGDTRFPVLGCDGIFMLPGVPQYFRAQLEAVLPRIPPRPVALRVLYLSLSEPELAPALDRVALAMPHVAFGSYPVFETNAGYRVKITVEHRQASDVEAAVARLEAELPEGAIVRRG